MSTRANDRKRRARSIASAFRVLRLDVGASAAEVKSAYKTLARAHHPDKTGGDADAFRRIQEAYEKLLAKHERDRLAMAAMDTATRDGGDARRRAASEARRGESAATVLELRQGEDGAALTRGGAEVASYTLQLQALKSGLGGLDHPHWQDSGGPTAFLTGSSHTVPKPPGGGRFRVRMRAVSTGDAAGEWQESEWSAPSNELTV